MDNKYAFQGMKENMARARAKDVEISTKVAIETANFLRGKTTEKAKNILDRVLNMKQAIPFKRFTDGVGHRKGAGIGSGRFPQKASTEFKRLIEEAEANAQAKGLSTELKITSIVANKGSNQFHSGRLSRRQYKRTHLEIIVEEMEAEKKPTKKVEKKATAKSSQKSESQAPKKPVAKEIKKEEPKPIEKKPEEKPVAKPEEKKEEKQISKNNTQTVEHSSQHTEKTSPEVKK